MKRIGIITYQTYHLKTEQVVLNLIGNYDIVVYALPFVQRPVRNVLFLHRPNQSTAAHPSDICKRYGMQYIPVSSDKEIGNICDLYLVTGAGILSADCLEGKQVLNAHPGIIPAVRGLDAFKWSIYNMLPLGVTLHYIDKNVDAGEVISVIATPVFPSDSLGSLARRHYENEINLLSNFENHLMRPENPFFDMPELQSMRRMKAEQEAKLTEKLELYKKKYCQSR